MTEPTGLEILKNSGYPWAKEAAEVMESSNEALMWIMPKVHQAYHLGEMQDCANATCVEYRRSINKFKEWNER